MTQARIAVIVGSLRRDSLNRKLAEAMIRLGPAGLTFEMAGIGDLPLYNQDDDADQPQPVRRLKDQILASQGVMFVTPEYNRSIPGVLKNALDCASRPYGQSAWAGKPAGILGISPGAVGTAAAQQHLRPILAYLDMAVMGQPEAYIQAKDGLFAPDGGIGEQSRGFLQGWMDRFAAWVRAHG
jgi:chromate reductase